MGKFKVIHQMLKEDDNEGLIFYLKRITSEENDDKIEQLAKILREDYERTEKKPLLFRNIE